MLLTPLHYQLLCYEALTSNSLLIPPTLRQRVSSSKPLNLSMPANLSPLPPRNPIPFPFPWTSRTTYPLTQLVNGGGGVGGMGGWACMWVGGGLVNLG